MADLPRFPFGRNLSLWREKKFCFPGSIVKIPVSCRSTQRFCCGLILFSYGLVQVLFFCLYTICGIEHIFNIDIHFEMKRRTSKLSEMTWLEVQHTDGYNLQWTVCFAQFLLKTIAHGFSMIHVRTGRFSSDTEPPFPDVIEK